MMENIDTAAKYLVESLLAKGIDTYFGVPGGPISPMFDAVLRTIGSTLIESRQETAAIFEAIGYYKSTGKIPAVLVSAGPGIVNSLNGIASAKALKIPVILIAGEVSWEQSEQILLQNGGPEGLNLESTFAAHTGDIYRSKDPTSLSKDIANLLDIKQNKLPTLIVLPINVSNSKVKEPNNIITKLFTSISSSMVCEVAELINHAKRPLFVIGSGARPHADQILELVGKLQIPCVTTPQGKGIVSENHKLSLRNAGLGASQWSREYLSITPDVVLVLGTDLDDCAIGTTEFANKNTKVIHVDLNPKVFNRKYDTYLGVIGDISKFCKSLSKIFNSSKNECNISILESIKKKSPFDVGNYYEDDNLPIAPHRVIADLQNSINDVRFVTDIGEHMLFSLHYLTIDKSKNFSIDLGLGSMGSGICQAIGLTIGDNKPTICIVGDGCMQMHGMEILTAIKYKLPIIFVVFNDARYNMVYHGFSFLFGRKENLGATDYIDFVKFAESLNICGTKIDKPGQINRDFINSLLKEKGPSILDVRINKDIRIVGAGRNEALKHMGEFSDGENN